MTATLRQGQTAAPNVPVMSVHWYAKANGLTPEEASSRWSAAAVSLRQLRTLRGWTLEDLADHIAHTGIQRPLISTLSRYERGDKRRPDVNLMRAWAAALDVPFGDITFPVTDGDQ